MSIGRAEAGASICQMQKILCGADFNIIATFRELYLGHIQSQPWEPLLLPEIQLERASTSGSCFCYPGGKILILPLAHQQWQVHLQSIQNPLSLVFYHPFSQISKCKIQKSLCGRGSYYTNIQLLFWNHLNQDMNTAFRFVLISAIQQSIIVLIRREATDNRLLKQCTKAGS